jgi:integrase
MGSITKRVSSDGKSISYRLRVFLGRDDLNGKQLFRTETCTGTKEQAKARLRELETQAAHGTLTEPSKMSLGAFIQKWLDESAGHNRKARTVQDLRGLFAYNIKESNLAKIQIARVTPLHIQEFVNELAKRLKPQSVKNIMSVIKGAFKAAVKLRFVVSSPARDVDIPRPTGEKVIRAMTDDEIWKLLETIDGEGREVVFVFALETGARPGEIVGLQWSDLCWETGGIKIQRTVMRPKGGGWRYDTPKTKNGFRIVPLGPTMIEKLRDHREKLVQVRALAGANWKENNLIFPNAFGEPTCIRLLSRIFKRMVTKAQLPGRIRLYDMRHSSATHLIANGISPAVVANRLGHGSVSLTLNTYTSVLPSMQQEATNKIAAMMYGRKSKSDPGVAADEAKNTSEADAPSDEPIPATKARARGQQGQQMVNKKRKPAKSSAKKSNLKAAQTVMKSASGKQR